MRIGEALAWAKAHGVDRLDAQLLLGHHLRCTRTWLMAHDHDEVPPETQAAFADDVRRRADQVPLAYLVGQREFRGLALTVGPGVLVPRPETEGLVDWALEVLSRRGPSSSPPRVIDLGTGSGAIALAIRHAWPAAEVTGTDAQAPALALARDNGTRLGLPVRWLQGSWWDPFAGEPFAGERFDLAVSNPPYISGSDPHLTALRHEPRSALTPEGDGLGALREIVHGAPARLARGGWLLLEHGFDQGAAVCALLLAAGFDQVQTRQDLAGLPRCSGACWPNIGSSR